MNLKKIGGHEFQAFLSGLRETHSPFLIVPGDLFFPVKIRDRIQSLPGTQGTNVGIGGHQTVKQCGAGPLKSGDHKDRRQFCRQDLRMKLKKVFGAEPDRKGIQQSGFNDHASDRGETTLPINRINKNPESR